MRALQGDARTNIISRPTITMQDNEESRIEVGQEVPFITGQYSTNTGNATAFNTVQREQVGTILSVTPQINEGNTVVLKVEIEISSIAPSSAGATDLITNKRTVKTTVLIPDAGTLVIGGLIQDSATNSEQRVPFLSRIPLIGELFRARDTDKTKTNLMVFLQPHILHDDRAAAVETDSKYEDIRNEQHKLGKESAVVPLAPFTKLDPMPPLTHPNLDAPPDAPAGAHRLRRRRAPPRRSRRSGRSSRHAAGRSARGAAASAPAAQPASGAAKPGSSP